MLVGYLCIGFTGVVLNPKAVAPMLHNGQRWGALTLPWSPKMKSGLLLNCGSVR